MPLSIQLWTVRDAASAEGWAPTIERVAALGFTHIEPFAIHLLHDKFEGPRTALGIDMPTAHGFLDPQNLEATLDAAEALGVTSVFHPHFGEEHWRDAEALGGTAQLLIEAEQAASERHIRIGFHNHEFELLHHVDGRPAFWALLDRLPASIAVEFDIYWAAIASVPIVEALGRLGDRATALHIKDGPMGATAADQVALGDGKLPLEGILAAAPRSLPVLSLDRMPGSVEEIWRSVERSRRWFDTTSRREGAPDV